MSDDQIADTVRQAFRAFNERRFDDFSGYMAEDVVEEYPQSGERLEGRDRQRRMHESCPEPPTFTIRRIRHAADLVVVEADETYPDGSVWQDTWIFELIGGAVAQMTGYFGEPFAAPEWRRPFSMAGLARS
jgi:ketosteroid isomerase-like protein